MLVAVSSCHSGDHTAAPSPSLGTHLCTEKTPQGITDWKLEVQSALSSEHIKMLYE